MPRIPDEHLGHFVRGVIDGDGTICFTKRLKVPRISILGSRLFVSQLAQRIADVASVSHSPVYWKSGCEKVGTLMWGGCADVLGLIEWLYPPGDYLFLARKRETAERFRSSPHHGKRLVRRGVRRHRSDMMHFVSGITGETEHITEGPSPECT